MHTRIGPPKVDAAAKKPVDKDLKSIVRLEEAARETARRTTGIALSFLFLVVVWGISAAQTSGVENGVFIIVAGVIGGYMALNIGANDVANNVGPAVGSRAMTMAGALVIAAIFEAAGAIIAGGDVVATISKGIVDPASIAEANTFIFAMTAALLAGALWLNLATWLGAPVSTTHSIVGGVLGAGMAAAGFGAVNWPTMGGIAASWVVSPLLGGIVAALFYYMVQLTILRRTDKVAAARVWVPVLVAVMSGAFSIYLVMKGFSHIWKPPTWLTLMIGMALAVTSWAMVRGFVSRRSHYLENRRKSIASLFTVPLIGSAALLSFAHGANDVANAVGPLAAVVSVAGSGNIAAKVSVPLWVMMVGAAGIAAGLVLFGPRVVRTVGEKITKLDPIRAFCVALSAAITVIAASAMGLPVSSTHIAVGAVFGIGFFREFQANRKNRHSLKEQAEAIFAAENGSGNGNGDGNGTDEEGDALALEKLTRKLEKARKRKLVRRSHLTTIVAAWLITVPLTALLAALLFFVLRALLSA